MDKLEIIEILNEWNYWNREVPPTIKRDFYDKKISKFITKDEVVVIKGVRRSGKSTLMLNQIKNLHQQGVPKNEILFVNPFLPIGYGLDFIQKDIRFPFWV